MNQPPLLLLDEPTASLDLPGRETVIGALERLAADEPALATVTVVHHVEDIAGLRHARAPPARGRERGAGTGQRLALTPATLSAAFGLPIELHRLGRRLAATVTLTAGASS